MSSLAVHCIAIVALVLGQVAAHVRPRDEPIPVIGYFPRVILWIGTALQAVAFFLLLTGALALQKQMGDFQVRSRQLAGSDPDARSQDGYNAAMDLITPPPTLDVAHAGNVYALLFSATSFSAITCVALARSSLAERLQPARRRAILSRLHAARGRLSPRTAEESVRVQALSCAHQLPSGQRSQSPS